MMPLLFLAAASADLDAVNVAVQHCDRAAVNPMFAGEAARRSEFLLEAYKEQEGIVADRLTLADQRRALRESGPAKVSDEKLLDLQQSDLEDRQKALDDKRLLETVREEAMDSLRHYFLLNCPAGGPDRVAR